MTDPSTEPESTDEELGSLTVEDNPDGTVDAGELAGTAEDGDEDLLPDYSENDLED